MNYHAPTKQFTTSIHDLDSATHSLLYAIKQIRLASGLDPKGYHYDGIMEAPHFAENSILRAAKYLGIDLGATCEGKLDVSEY